MKAIFPLLVPLMGLTLMARFTVGRDIWKSKDSTGFTAEGVIYEADEICHICYKKSADKHH